MSTKQLTLTLNDDGQEYVTTLDLAAVGASPSPVTPDPDPTPTPEPSPDPGQAPYEGIARLYINVEPDDARILIAQNGSLIVDPERGDRFFDLPLGDYDITVEHTRLGSRQELVSLTETNPAPLLINLEEPRVGAPVVEGPPTEPGTPDPEPTAPSTAAVTREAWEEQPKMLFADCWVTQVNALYDAISNSYKPYPVKSNEVFRAIEHQSARPGYEGWTYIVTDDVLSDNGVPRDWADQTNPEHGYMTIVVNHPVELAIVGQGQPSWVNKDDGWYQLSNGHWAKQFPAGDIVLGAPERAYDRVPLYDVAFRHADGSVWQLPELASNYTITDNTVPPQMRHDILIGIDAQGRKRFGQHMLMGEWSGLSFEHEHGSHRDLFPLPHLPLYDLVDGERLFHRHSAFKDFHFRWHRLGGGTLNAFITTYLAGGLEVDDLAEYDIMRVRWRHFEMKLYDEQLGELVGHYWGGGDYGTFEGTDGVGSPVVLALGEKHDGVRNEHMRRYHGMRGGVRQFPYPTMTDLNDDPNGRDLKRYHSSGEIKATTEGSNGYWTLRPDLGWAAMGLMGTISFQHNDPGYWVKSETEARLVRHGGQNGWMPNRWAKRWLVPQHMFGVSAIDLYRRMVYRGFRNSVEEAQEWHEAHSGYIFTNDWELSDAGQVITPAGTEFLEQGDPRATITLYQKPGYEGMFDTFAIPGSPTGIRFFTSGHDRFLGQPSVGWFKRDYYGHLPQQQATISANGFGLAVRN